MKDFSLSRTFMYAQRIMGHIGERIRFMREHRKLTQEALSKSLGVSKRAIIFWEKGRSAPSSPLLPLLQQALGCNMHWLSTGQGEPFQRRYTDLTQPLTVKPPEPEAREVRFESADVVPVPERNQLKVYAKAAADKDIAFAEAIQTVWADARFKSDDHYGLVVHGRSMYPTISEGDRVIVRKAFLVLEPYDPERGPADLAAWRKLHEHVVCASVDGGDALIKRLFIYDQPKSSTGFMMFLQSDNRGVAPIPVWRNTRLEIWGLVVEISRDPMNYE